MTDSSPTGAGHQPTPGKQPTQHHARMHVPRTSRLFWSVCGVIVGSYSLFIIALIWADYEYTSLAHMRHVLQDPNIIHSIFLSLITCTMTAILSLWTAVPAGYLFSRWQPRARILQWIKTVAEVIIDVPIILPPLVIGISLLIFFRTAPGVWFEQTFFVFTYEQVGLILAQYTVGCAFAIKAMRNTFTHIPERPELIARTLGASRSQSFWHISFPPRDVAWCPLLV